MATSQHYRVRPLELPKDREACAAAQVSAFEHNHWPFWKKAHNRLAPDFIGVMAGMGNLNWVAEEVATGRVVGFVFTGYPLDGKAMRRTFGAILKLLGFSLVSLLVWKGVTFRHAGRYLPAMYRLIKVHPQHDPHAEVIEFAMHESARGKGAGRMLMDRAVRALHEKGAKQVVLMTDSTMSWKFYERYGYSRVRDVDFGDAYELATGSKSEHGYSYELDIPKKIAELEKMTRAD